MILYYHHSNDKPELVLYVNVVRTRQHLGYGNPGLKPSSNWTTDMYFRLPPVSYK